VGGILKEMLIEAIPRLLPGESIGKEIVSLQIPEVLSDEAIQERLCKKNFIGKTTVSFQTPEFLRVKRSKYFYRKKVEQSNCIISNPRFF
jgi:hypothetical protein